MSTHEQDPRKIIEALLMGGGAAYGSAWIDAVTAARKWLAQPQPEQASGQVWRDLGPDEAPQIGDRCPIIYDQQPRLAWELYSPNDRDCVLWQRPVSAPLANDRSAEDLAWLKTQLSEAKANWKSKAEEADALRRAAGVDYDLNVPEGIRAIATLKAASKSEWISAETPPTEEDGPSILFRFRDGSVVIHDWSYYLHREKETPPYWMRIPPLPSADTETESDEAAYREAELRSDGIDHREQSLAKFFWDAALTYARKAQQAP